MLDRKKYKDAIEHEMESGARRDAHKCIAHSMRIAKDGHGTAFCHLADLYPKPKPRKKTPKELAAWLVRNFPLRVD